jgi:hypothetical protein
MRLFVALSVFCMVLRGKHAEKFRKDAAPLCRGPESYWGEKTTTEGHQKILKAKLVIAFVFLVMLWVSVAGVEYELVM